MVGFTDLVIINYILRTISIITNDYFKLPSITILLGIRKTDILEWKNSFKNFFFFNIGGFVLC